MMEIHSYFIVIPLDGQFFPFYSTVKFISKKFSFSKPPVQPYNSMR